MGIVKEYGKYIVVCELCDDMLPAEDSHVDARHAAKEAGWLTKQVDGTYEAYCDKCRKEGNK